MKEVNDKEKSRGNTRFNVLETEETVERLEVCRKAVRRVSLASPGVT